MDDKMIIDLYLAREEGAIKETEKAYGKALSSLAFGILKNTEDAKECVNDTYLNTWNSIPPQNPTYFYAFIAKICRYLCFGKLDYRNAKKRSFETIALSEELASCIPLKLSSAEWQEEEIGQLLTSFLKTLPEESRLIFLRRYWFCATISEIAQHYGVSESKVKTSLHRTRKRLRSYLEKEEIFI